MIFWKQSSMPLYESAPAPLPVWSCLMGRQPERIDWVRWVTAHTLVLTTSRGYLLSDRVSIRGTRPQAGPAYMTKIYARWSISMSIGQHWDHWSTCLRNTGDSACFVSMVSCPTLVADLGIHTKCAHRP